MEDIALVIKIPKKYYDVVKEQVKSGINYCLNTFDRNGLSINKINKESEE